jgi:glycosyltransferase involved in cell wall biosynthesis
MFLSTITRNPAADCALPLPEVTGDSDADVTENFFTGYYSIAGCIGRYGVSAYLKILRARFEKGLYDTERFCLLAAKAYLWAGRPKRCLSLLDSHQPGRQESIALFRELIDEATLACSSRECSCSLNMIVRNEERNIAAALDSVDDIMDEIVICDTGSTDRTIEIAKIFGTVIVHNEWKNDFSAARNAALESSTGKWVLWLDADDRLKPQSRRQFVNLVETAGPHAAAFRVVNIQDGAQGAQFMQVRLFPRLKGARFERRIHEQISPCMTRLGVPYVEHQSIVIFHEGYNDAMSNRKKALRNKPLIMAEIAESQETPVLLLSLADCHMILGEAMQSLAMYERVISHPSAQELYPNVYIQAHFNIGLLYRELGNFEVAKIWFEKTLRLDSNRTEAIYLLGLIAEGEGKKDEAFSCFLDCSKRKPPVRQTATDSEKIRVDCVYRVSQYLFDKGMIEQCEGILKTGIEKYPAAVNFHTLLGKVFLCKSEITEAARHFTTSLSLAPANNPDPCRGLATIYLMLGDRKKAREFLALTDEPAQELEETRFDPDRTSISSNPVGSGNVYFKSMAAA